MLRECPRESGGALELQGLTLGVVFCFLVDFGATVFLDLEWHILVYEVFYCFLTVAPICLVAHYHNQFHVCNMFVDTIEMQASTPTHSLGASAIPRTESELIRHLSSPPGFDTPWAGKVSPWRSSCHGHPRSSRISAEMGSRMVTTPDGEIAVLARGAKAAISHYRTSFVTMVTPW